MKNVDQGGQKGGAPVRKVALFFGPFLAFLDTNMAGCV